MVNAIISCFCLDGHMHTKLVRFSCLAVALSNKHRFAAIHIPTNTMLFVPQCETSSHTRLAWYRLYHKGRQLIWWSSPNYRSAIVIQTHISHRCCSTLLALNRPLRVVIRKESRMLFSVGPNWSNGKEGLLISTLVGCWWMISAVMGWFSTSCHHVVTHVKQSKAFCAFAQVIPSWHHCCFSFLWLFVQSVFNSHVCYAWVSSDWLFDSCCLYRDHTVIHNSITIELYWNWREYWNKGDRVTITVPAGQTWSWGPGLYSGPSGSYNINAFGYSFPINSLVGQFGRWGQPGSGQ